MPPIHNRYDYNPLRRQLRNKGTTAEAYFWLWLKCRQMLGYKFRRQHSIGRYIVDFYCPKLRLVVELDGGQHTEHEALAYDRTREQYLNSLNIQVVRFNNSDIFSNESGVVEHLEEIVRRRAISLDHPDQHHFHGSGAGHPS